MMHHRVASDPSIITSFINVADPQSSGNIHDTSMLLPPTNTGDAVRQLNTTLTQRLYLSGKERVLVHHICADPGPTAHISQIDFVMAQLRATLPAFCNFLLLNKNRSEYGLIYIGKRVHSSSSSSSSAAAPAATQQVNREEQSAHQNDDIAAAAAAAAAAASPASRAAKTTATTTTTTTTTTIRKMGAFPTAAAALEMKQKLVRFLHFEIFPELVADLTEVVADDASNTNTNPTGAAGDGGEDQQQASAAAASGFGNNSNMSNNNNNASFYFTQTRVPWNILIAEKVVMAQPGGAGAATTLGRYFKLVVTNIEKLHYDIADNSRENARWEERRLFVRVLDSLCSKSNSYEAYAEAFREACIFMIQNYDDCRKKRGGGGGAAEDDDDDDGDDDDDNASSSYPKRLQSSSSQRRQQRDDGGGGGGVRMDEDQEARQYLSQAGDSGAARHSDDDEFMSSDDLAATAEAEEGLDWASYPVEVDAAAPSCPLLAEVEERWGRNRNKNSKGGPSLSPSVSHLDPQAQQQLGATTTTTKESHKKSVVHNGVRCTFVQPSAIAATTSQAGESSAGGGRGVSIPFGSVLRSPESSTLDFKSLQYRTLEWVLERVIQFGCGFLNSYGHGRLMIGVMEMAPYAQQQQQQQSGVGNKQQQKSSQLSPSNTSSGAIAAASAAATSSEPELSGKLTDQVVFGVDFSVAEMQYLGAAITAQCKACIPPVPPEVIHVNAIPCVLPDYLGDDDDNGTEDMTTGEQKKKKKKRERDMVEPIILLYDTTSAWRDNFRAKNNMLIRRLTEHGLGLCHLPNFVVPIEERYDEDGGEENDANNNNSGKKKSVGPPASPSLSSSVATPVIDSITVQTPSSFNSQQQQQQQQGQHFLWAPTESTGSFTGSTSVLPARPPASPTTNLAETAAPTQQPRNLSRFSLLKNLIDPLPAAATTIAFKVIPVSEHGARLMKEFSEQYAAARDEQNRADEGADATTTTTATAASSGSSLTASAATSGAVAAADDDESMERTTNRSKKIAERVKRAQDINGVEYQVKTTWKPFEKDVGLQVIDAWTRLLTVFEYKSRGVQFYEIDFSRMTQRNTTTNNIRAIRFCVERPFAFVESGGRNMKTPAPAPAWLSSIVEDMERASRGKGGRTHAIVAAAGAATPKLHVLDISFDMRRAHKEPPMLSSAAEGVGGGGGGGGDNNSNDDDNNENDDDDDDAVQQKPVVSPSSYYKGKFFTGWPTVPMFDPLTRRVTTLGRDYSLGVLSATGNSSPPMEERQLMLKRIKSTPSPLRNILSSSTKNGQLPQQQQPFAIQLSSTTADEAATGTVAATKKHRYSKRARRLFDREGIVRRLFKFLPARDQRTARLCRRSFNAAFESAFQMDLISLLLERKQFLPFFANQSVSPAQNRHTIRIIQRHLLRQIQKKKQLQQQNRGHHIHQQQILSMPESPATGMTVCGGMLPRFPALQFIARASAHSRASHHHHATTGFGGGGGSSSVPATPTDQMTFPVPPLTFSLPAASSQQQQQQQQQQQFGGSVASLTSLTPASMFPLQLCWLLERGGSVPAPFPFIPVPLASQMAHQSVRPAAHLIPIYFIAEIVPAGAAAASSSHQAQQQQHSSFFNNNNNAAAGAGAAASGGERDVLSRGAFHVAVVLDTRDGTLKTWHPSSPDVVKTIVGVKCVRLSANQCSSDGGSTKIFAVVFVTANETSGTGSTPAKEHLASSFHHHHHHHPHQQQQQTSSSSSASSKAPQPLSHAHLLQRNTAAFASFDDASEVTMSSRTTSPATQLAAGGCSSQMNQHRGKGNNNNNSQNHNSSNAASCSAVPGAWQLSTLLLWLQIAVSDPLARLCDSPSLTVSEASNTRRRAVLPELFGSGSTFAIVADHHNAAHCCVMHENTYLSQEMCKGGGIDTSASQSFELSSPHHLHSLGASHLGLGGLATFDCELHRLESEWACINC